MYLRLTYLKLFLVTLGPSSPSLDAVSEQQSIIGLHLWIGTDRGDHMDQLRDVKQKKVIQAPTYAANYAFDVMDCF